MSTDRVPADGALVVRHGVLVTPCHGTEPTRLVEYTDTHAFFIAWVDVESKHVGYRFSRTYDGMDGFDERWACECGADYALPDGWEADEA